MEQWKPIPGYPGYEASWSGKVRSYNSSKGPRPTPHLLRINTRRRGTQTVSLHKDGKRMTMGILRIQVLTWLGGCPEGLRPYHKNGVKTDNRIENIAFADKHQLGHMTGHKGRRKPVAKLSPSGEVLEIYPSITAAAKDNYISMSAISRRCRREVQDPTGLDGFDYRFEL